MSVTHPEAFWILLLLLPALLSAFFRYKRSIRVIAALLGRGANNRGANSRGASSIERLRLRLGIETAFVLLFIAASSCALADFSWGSELVPEERAGLDIVFVADLSRSMEAIDAVPSRLGASVNAMRRIVADIPSARFGLRVFKGDSIELLPLTDDPESIEVALESLSPALMTAPGTDLQAGVEGALYSFSQESAAFRVIVLFSDGESLVGSAETAAAKAAAEGVIVFCVGAGSEAGSLVPDGSGGALTDRDGKNVVSALKRAPLRTIALATGGGYFDLSDSQSILEIKSRLSELARDKPGTAFRQEPVHQYKLFLVIAIACLILSYLAGLIKWED